MAYQYRGTIRDVKEAPKKRTKPLGKFSPDKCGTYAGYRRHQNHNLMPACAPCQEAQRTYDREQRTRYRTKQGAHGYKPEKCGTVAGHAQHNRYGIPHCQPCRDAYNQYCRELTKRKKGQP